MDVSGKRSAGRPGLVGSVRNLALFIKQDTFHLFAFAGLLLCINKKFLPLGVIGLWTMFMLVKNRGNLVLFYYQAVVVLPILALGWARLYSLAKIFLQKHLQKPPLAYLFFLFPLTMLVSSVSQSLKGSITPRNQYWVTQDTQEVEKCAHWLNDRTQPQDLIIANSSITWLLQSRCATLMQVVTWYSLPTQGYENGNARDRFRYKSSLEVAKFVVIGDIDQRWTFGEPNVHKLVERLQTNHWSVVWQGNYYLVLANPAYLP